MTSGGPAPAIELRGLTKAFRVQSGPGGEPQWVVANEEVSLAVQRGSIHAVIGENGAGKSTAMKMLYGMVEPDAGEIWIHGKPRKWTTPSDAIAAGIGMVHQHFMLAGPYSVLENLLLGAEQEASRLSFLPRSLRPVNRLKARQDLQRLAREQGFELSLDSPVERLPVGIQQRIEILKLLYRKAEILILDEPTAVLTPQETEELFTQLKKLASQGKTVVVITHKLKEVMRWADRATILRAGRVVGEREVHETSVEELASLMVGRRVNLTAQSPEALAAGLTAVKLTGLRYRPPGDVRDRLNGLDLVVRNGEIVGIAGVEGNGQNELVQALLDPRGMGSALKGEVRLFGENLKALSCAQIRELGVALVPADRHRDGLLLKRPLWENFILGVQRHYTGKLWKLGGWLSQDKILTHARKAIQKYDVRPNALEMEAGSLSGGNQQKLIIGRELERKPKFLIAAQPTRGVDVGAIEDIHERILRARTRGTAVLLISSELDEILALSDRIVVLYDGKAVAELKRREADEKTLGMYMGGAH